MHRVGGGHPCNDGASTARLPSRAPAPTLPSRIGSAMIASLPMYDLPELRAATDAWWAGVARHCRARGIAGAPRTLQRDRPRERQWQDPSLLLSQTCGHPLAARYARTLRPVATPCYGAPGCSGPRYRSLLLVREDDPARGLEQLAGTRFAVNGHDSWSGWHALVRELARRETTRGRTITVAVVTGTHRASIAAVAAGEARACAVDCVTHALLARTAPRELAGLRIVDRTASAPALPYVTRAALAERDFQRLRAALLAAVADPALAAIRATLLIAGAQPLEMAAYAAMRGGGGTLP